MGYDDQYAEHYQLQDQGTYDGTYDGDGAGYVQQDQIIVGSNPNASSLFRSEEMALCQLFLQVEKPKFYFFDTGIVRALAHHLALPLLPSTSAYGRAFEHFLINECLRLASYYKKDYQSHIPQ